MSLRVPMKLRGRVAVEPLDEDRLTNIERRIVAGAADAAARGARPSHGFARLGFAGALVAAGVAGWLLHRAPSAPAVADATPIFMESTSRTTLDIGDAVIQADPSTAFTVTRPAGGVLVSLAHGKVALAVGKRHERPPLVVSAGDTEVVVVGTEFSVDYGDGHGDVDVKVTEGVVRVVHQQQETRVAKGQAWQTHRGLIASAASTSVPSTDNVPNAANATNAANAASTSSATAATSPNAASPNATAADTTVAVGPPTDLLHQRTAAVPIAPAPPHAAAPTHTITAERPLDQTAVRAHAAPRAADPLVDLRTAIFAQRLEPALNIGEPDPASAVSKYYAIAAHTSGEDASQAFYSIAVLRHTRLGRNADALQALDAYMRRFPGGKEYRAVLWLRLRILCLDKIDDRCRAAAYSYLQQAPDDPAAHVAELITLSPQ